MTRRFGISLLSFLALVPMKELQERLDSRNEQKHEWGDKLGDHEELKQIRITSDGKEVIITIELKGDMGKVFQAGVAVPPKVCIPRMAKNAGTFQNNQVEIRWQVKCHATFRLQYYIVIVKFNWPMSMMGLKLNAHHGDELGGVAET